MAQKVFPIRTATACQLKWNWSTLYLYSGNTASCHRTGWDKITPDSFNEFHNTSKKQHERKLMLEGKWPEDSCQYCQKIEQAGGFSDRLLHLDIPNMSPPELDTDVTATSVSPTILEVFFNNTCNLSCIYCVPNLSSKINQEYRKYGDFVKDGVQLVEFVKDPTHQQILEHFWEWMQHNSQHLRRFNVLGGEPFYQDEFDRCLEYFENTPHPNLELGIVTNLMVNKAKLQNYIDRFRQLLARKHLRRIDITCSIDCDGPEQEYVRHGINLEQWNTNFELLLSHRWLTVNINQTISLLTIKTMPALLKKIQQWRHNRSVGHYFSAVTPQPSYLAPSVLGNVFDKDFDAILSLMPETSDKNYMAGIAQEIKTSKRNEQEIQKLQIYLDENDRRRGTNWKQTFPWLLKEITNVVQ